MNLNKEERLEQIRNILVGSQVGNLEEKVAFLEKNIADDNLKEQFEKRINDLEKFVYEELGSFKQLFGLEQAKHEKVFEQLQQLQTTSQDLSIKLNNLEKQDVTYESLEKQFEKRINDLEKFISEGQGSFKQLLVLEQAKYEKVNENLQSLQITSQKLSVKVSNLEKKVEQNQNPLESNELAEIRKQLESLQLSLSSQEIENKSAYKQLHKGAQEYTEQWSLTLSELEQKSLGRDQILKKHLLEYSKRSYSRLQELKEKMLESNKEQRAYFLTQLNLVLAEIKGAEDERLESKKTLVLESPHEFSDKFHSYCKISNRKSVKEHWSKFLGTRLWGRIRLNGRKRKENHF